MAKLDKLTNVLAEEIGTDAKVLEICTRRLRAAGYLPDAPDTLMNAANAASLLIATLTLPLGSAPNASVPHWGNLPLANVELGGTVGEQFATLPIDVEEAFGDCDVWRLKNALADMIRAYQRGDVLLSVRPQFINIGAFGGHPFGTMSISLGVDDDGVAITRFLTWRHPDDDYWGRRDDLPPCALEMTIRVDAQILEAFAEALGDHDSAAHAPVRDGEIMANMAGVE